MVSRLLLSVIAPPNEEAAPTSRVWLISISPPNEPVPSDLKKMVSLAILTFVEILTFEFVRFNNDVLVISFVSVLEPNIQMILLLSSWSGAITSVLFLGAAKIPPVAFITRECAVTVLCCALTL